MARPAFIWLTAGGLATGWKKPANGNGVFVGVGVNVGVAVNVAVGATGVFVGVSVGVAVGGMGVLLVDARSVEVRTREWAYYSISFTARIPTIWGEKLWKCEQLTTAVGHTPVTCAARR